MVFNHPVDARREFPHDGEQSLHCEFAFGRRVLVEGTQVRMVLHGQGSGAGT